MDFEPVIGLEVHVQLSTASKIFCACPAKPAPGKSVADVGSNQFTCPVCTGQPGALPVLNRAAVEYAARAGLATGCKIRDGSRFARKNYFYADSPKGYQISQHAEPICESGTLTIETSSGSKTVRIQRMHLEEDAGKNVHAGAYSLVNLNRAGVPLIEIVSEPDLRSSEEAGAYLRELYAIVTFLGICDGNLQEGNFRCDANVSIRPRGAEKFGTRVEIKNVNSFRFIEKAIDYEIARQAEVLKSGGRVIQETRGYDSQKDATFSMRSKEEAQDYRYFPDPDLLPVPAPREWVEKIRAALPELPAQKRARYVQDFGLSAYDAGVLTGSRELVALFDGAVAHVGGDARTVAKPLSNLITGEVARLARETEEPGRLTAAHLGELVKLLNARSLSSTAAKKVIGIVWKSGEAVSAVVEREGLAQVSDTSALEPLVEALLKEFPAQADELRSGKDKVMGFLVGQAMKRSQGKANPALLQELIRKKL